MQPGVYSLTIEKDGFEKSVQDGITLTVGQVANINVALHLGQTSETVTINADTALVNTSTSEISQVINENSVKELPLNGRDPSSLVLLTTGISNVLQAAGNAGIASFNGESLPDETDKRGRRVALTAAGKQKLAEAKALWNEAQTRFENAYGAAKASKLRALLAEVYSDELELSFLDE